MHWEVIDNNRFEVLGKISKNISVKDYYMAGGTALSLQTGYRESFDFDFFTPSEFNTDLLIEELSKIGELKVTNYMHDGTLHCLLDGVQVTFLRYRYPLIRPIVYTDRLPMVGLASIEDIAAMKMMAISQRGAKKDFYDLYCICQDCHFSLQDVFALLNSKYKNTNYNAAHIAMSLKYFDDAESQVLPKTFVKCDWDTIKKFFLENEIQPIRQSVRSKLEALQAKQDANPTGQTVQTVNKNDKVKE